MAIKRGELLSTVSATGTIEAEEVVNVVAQVAGLIVGFGDDSALLPGMLIFAASLRRTPSWRELTPPSTRHAQQAEAILQNTEANLMQLEAVLRKAERVWKCAESLLPQKAISETDYDTALSDYESAKANVASGKAIIRQNIASVKTARINLGYCTIKSPVRGTIIERRVNIGQTVVATLNAPSLFLIAKDLSKMQVWASANEADIGRIRLKMPVRFTVDAYDGEEFRGEVTQIRMNAQMTQNVVTYTVIVTTDNSSGKLLPYLTANVHFEVNKRSGVLLVPNAGLRWTPDAEQVDPTVDKTMLADDGTRSQERGRLWVISQSGLVRPLEVAVGATDGAVTEISGSRVVAGMRVVAGRGRAPNPSRMRQLPRETKRATHSLPKIPKGSKPPPGPM